MTARERGDARRMTRLLVLLAAGFALLVGASLGSVSPADAQSGCHGCRYPSTPTLPDRQPVPDLPDQRDPRGLPDVPEEPIGPGTDAPSGARENQLDPSATRVQPEVDQARRRLTRAASDRAIADDRRLHALPLARLRRERANRLRQRAANAEKRANAAEDRMVAARESSLEHVRAQRAAYRAELLAWLGNRAGAFALATWLLLMAVLAAAWRPMVAWLALRRAGGLEAQSYAKAVAVAAASLALGAAAALALFATLRGVLAPLAVPVIAGMVLLLGVAAWHASAARIGSGRFSPGLAGRRAVPGMVTGLTLVAGLGIGLLGFLPVKPAEPRIAPSTAALARLAQGDPTAKPTKHVARLLETAGRADRDTRRAEALASAAEAMLRDSEDDVRAADDRIAEAKRGLDRWRQRAGDLPVGG